MQTNQTDHAGVNRLRCILDGKVVSFTFAATATFGEVAGKLGDLSRKRHGKPAAIEITLAGPATFGGRFPDLFPLTAESIAAHHTGARSDAGH